MLWDWTWIILLPAVILGIYAQARVSAAFSKWSRVAARRGMTGADAASFLLRAAGIYDVQIEPSRGFLSDHYDPRQKVLRLSPEVYGRSSIAAIGVAAHEAGHAIQHAEQYPALALRNALVPLASMSNLWILLFFIGFLFASPTLQNLGILLFGATVLFMLFTLPVEFDASRRALRALDETGLLAEDELRGARQVLSAAAMTYVAAALMAVLQLLRLMMLRRED
ncbi:MAG: zinc metallopeptidase [Armatimonadetes bacterium]|nr:zinc metallopeptidase [Armatimonadota bacterium]